MDVDGREGVEASAHTSETNVDNPATKEDVCAEDGVDGDDDGDGSSDESMDGEDEEEQRWITRAAELETQVQENPYLYEGYKELITLYKSLGELDQLRDIRNRFSDCYPLTEELWMEWINDEKELVTEPADKLKIVDLFEKAVKDYQSVPLWIEYCTFAIGLGEKARCREVMSRAIENAGYHLNEGKLLWDLKIEYETVCQEQEKQNEQQTSAGDSEAMSRDKMETLKDEQQRAINDIYYKLLATPIVGIRDAFDEYQAKCGFSHPDAAVPARHTIPLKLYDDHKQALDIIESCNKFENDLVLAENDEDKRKIYDTYLTSYITHHPTLTKCIRCLFERAISEHCLDQNLWIKYARFLEKNIVEDFELIRSVYSRSVRNCPWSGTLWVSYCLILERHGLDLPRLVGLLEEALESGLQTAEDFLHVWTTYCDIIRRKINWEEVDNALLDKLRVVFERAIQHILKNYGEEGDSECVLPKYWALLEVKYCNNLEKAREIWNESLAGWRNDKANAWLEYASFERSYGDHKHCRKVFRRALKVVSDWPESICAEYIRFEKEEGTIEQLYVAQTQAADVRQKLAAEMRNRPPRAADHRRPQARDKRPQANDKRPFKGTQAQDGNSRKEKMTPNREAPVTVYKRKRDQPQPSASSNGGDGFTVPAPPQPKKQKTSETEASTSSASTPVTYTLTDQRTVFVSNLSYSTTEQQLGKVFLPCGEIKEIRIMKGKGDKSKGFAYVEFVLKDSVGPALLLDRTPIEGRPLYVKLCDRERNEKAPKLKYDTGMEKCKLFVSGLSYSLTQEQVRSEFSKHVKVKEVRIVTYKGGKSKGLAYVELYNEVDARQALLAMDGAVLDNFTIKVAISNPPARKPTAGDTTGSQFVPSLGGASRQVAESQPRGRARTQLNLMPRVVQRAPTVAATSATASTIAPGVNSGPSSATDQPPSAGGDSSGSSNASHKRMTNAEFRAMLLKK